MSPVRYLAAAWMAVAIMAGPLQAQEGDQVRARDIGLAPGVLTPGPLNAITDVEGVQVGHVTLTGPDFLRTGVTAIRPHPGDEYADRVPAALAVAPSAAVVSARKEFMVAWVEYQLPKASLVAAQKVSPSAAVAECCPAVSIAWTTRPVISTSPGVPPPRAPVQELPAKAHLVCPSSTVCPAA